MSIDPNDPKLTAYALGELDDTERAVVEAQLAESPEARLAVEEIRKVAETLTEQLQGESAPVLLDAQREAIEERAARMNGQARRSDSRTIPFWRRHWIPSALAASVLIAVGIGYTLLPSLHRSSPFSKGLLERLAMKGPARYSEMKGIGTSVKQWADPVSAMQGVDREEHVAFWESDSEFTGGKGQDFSLDGSAGQRSKKLSPPINDSDDEFAISWPTVDMSQVNRGGGGGGGGSGQSIFLGGKAERGKGGPAGMAVSAEALDAWLRNYANTEGPPSPVPLMDSDTASLWEGTELTEDDTGPATEAYDRIVDNPFLAVAQSPLSTFSIDVDTASYSNVRRYLTQDVMPPKDAVRIEEMINYFTYDYPPPLGDDPFSVNVDVVECPWQPDHLLARVGLKGYELDVEERPVANLVFLIDVSGSMQHPAKLPLLQDSLRLAVGELTDDDSVAMVVYAGASGLVLPSTSCASRGVITAALDRLRAGGSTNGGAGIQLAYDVAEENFIEGGINRVILATDGDFNVGVTNQGDLTRLIEEKAQSGVFLSVLGFGMGNYKDATLEMLADKGNGNYAYIDTLKEARKVLVDQLSGTLVTIAKDVKIQIEFNPEEVAAYRLIGYENRLLRAEDFNDDTKDAGEIGAGHTVTALYELVPAGGQIDLPEVDPLKYQTEASPTDTAESGELMTVKLRYKEPDGHTSKLIEMAVVDEGLTLADSSEDFSFAAAVASFGMLLRDSPHKGESTFDDVLDLAEQGIGDDEYGYRAEFIELVNKARTAENFADRRSAPRPRTSPWIGGRGGDHLE